MTNTRNDMRTDAPERPLQSITAVEMGHSVAAPVAGLVLADLGARLVKVERPGRGDDARTWGPPFWHGAAAVFQALNRNKISVAVDLKDSAELARLREFIIEEADIVIQNMRPGLVSKLGLGGEQLRRENPRLIYCNLWAYGSRGPLQMHPGYDPLMQAFGGIMSVTGDADGPPVRVGPSIVDQGAGLWAVIGILAALERRHATGLGTIVETSLYETALSWMNTTAANYQATGKVPGKRGSEHPSLTPYKVFETSDGHMMIAVGNDNLFARLADALGHPEWAQNPDYASNPDRVKRRVKVNAMVQDIVATQPVAHWQKLFEEHAVPSAPLQTIDQVVSHPQTKALEFFQPTPDGAMTLGGLPLTFDGARPPLLSPPPELGAGNAILFDHTFSKPATSRS